MISNYFYSLPCDIQEYILEIRDNNCANLIIDKWYRYIDKKMVASQLLINLLQNFNHTIFIDITDKHTVNVLEYCNKLLTGNESYWWTRVFMMIEKQFKVFNIINIHFTDFPNDEKIYYNKIKNIIKELKDKFDWA